MSNYKKGIKRDYDVAFEAFLTASELIELQNFVSRIVKSERETTRLNDGEGLIMKFSFSREEE